MTPLVPVALFLVMGLVVGQVVPLPWAGVWAGCGILWSCYLVLAMVRPVNVATWVVLVAAALSLGLLLALPPAWPSRIAKKAEHVLVGEVRALRLSAGGHWRMVLELQGAAVVGKAGRPQGPRPVTGLVWLYRSEPFPRWLLPGDQVLVRARSLRRGQRRNFGDDPRVSPAALSGRVVAGPLLVGHQGGLTGGAQRLRRLLRERLAQQLSPRPLGLVLALVTGDRTVLDDGDVVAFRRAGTAHLLAISGLHLSMVSMASFWLLSLLLLCTPLAQRFRVAQLAAFGASLCCWTYALLTGMAPPALRAAVMTTAAMGAVAMGRPNDAWRGIVFAAAILTTWRPELIWTAGFHLSFSAVIALHGHGGRRESKEQDAESTGPPGLAVRCWHRSRQIVGASTVAALATAPWVAHHFGQVSLMGVVANALAVPVVGALLLPGVFLAAIASVIPLPGRGYFFLAVDGGVTFFLDAMGWLARCSWSSQTVPRPNLWEAGLLCVALLLVSGAGRYRFNWAAALAVALVAVVSWIWRTHAPQWTQSLRVTFLDIGAGDATLVQFPTGQAMLVDAGPSFGDLKGPPLVVALVQRAGTMPLDLLALTHRHNDHVAGLGAMSTQVGFPHLWLPFAEEWSLPRPVGFGRRLLQPLPVAPRCGTVRWGEVTVQVLHPCSDEDRRLSENDRSLVLRLAWRGVAFLLPGDIEEETEAILLRRGVPLQATVLKLPHHGSDTSTSAAFLAAVSPALAIASCRAGGRNPLPHSAVHRRVVRSGAVLLSTAEVGAVRVTTTGQTVAVATARDGLIFRELSGVVPYEDSGATGPAAPLHRVSSE